MRYHIDTIPVWDAMKLDGECFLCALKRKTEIGEVEHYLGASVMEPDTRIQVNHKGFCCNHQVMLTVIGKDNRLGHALMLESHVAETRERLEKACKRIRSARMTEAGGRTLFNLVPFVKNGEAAFYDTVSKTWKTRYYANRADLQTGPAAVGGGMAQGVSPLVRAPGKGLIIQVR